MVSANFAVPKKFKKNKVKNSPKVEKIKKTAKKKETPKANIDSKLVQQKTVKDIKDNKNKKYVMPSKVITNDLVVSCLNAMQELAIQYKKKNTIFEDETPIFAEINCIKIQNNAGNIKFVLPHCTIPSTGEVCLITPDMKKGRKIDHEPTIDHWEEILRKAGVTKVKTVLPMRQLRVEYDQYELKRRLLTQHDFIMVDTRILSHVSHILGKMFFKKHNMLIPVRIDEKHDVKKDIDVGLHTAILRLSQGQTSTIIIGHTGMPQNALKDNIMSLVEQLRNKYPGGEANIRSINIKLPLSLALPLYLTLRPSNSINPPKVVHKKPKHYTVVEDELSTRPGNVVRVAPDGTVHLKKLKKVDVSDRLEDDNNEVENEGDDSQEEEQQSD